MKQPRIVKTEYGYEPEYWFDGTPTIPAGWYVEPGFARPTRAEAEAQLNREIANWAAVETAAKEYLAGLDYACGIRD